jgi:hypothetical protein
MEPVTLDLMTVQLQLAEQLHAGRNRMFEPQDLPGRYGRVVAALDHLLQAIQCESVVGGGWAGWRHGYAGRVTRDIDIVLPADKVDEFLQSARFGGFQVLAVPPGRWPKLVHRDTTRLRKSGTGTSRAFQFPGDSAVSARSPENLTCRVRCSCRRQTADGRIPTLWRA